MNCKILIVEDEAIEAMNFQQSLKSIGYNVVGIASTGEDALEKVAELKPDLVLMDIILKGDMDGIEAALKIHDDFNIPVVYLTAHPEESTVKRAKLTSPYGYLIKPVNNVELKNTIELALYKFQMETKLRESEEKYKTLFNKNPLCTITLSSEGLILDANDMVNNLTGLNKEKIIGKNPFEVGIFPLEDRKDHERRLKSIITNEEIEPYTCQITINHQKKLLKSIFTPIMKDDQIDSILIIIEDITENKKTTFLLQNERNKLKNILDSMLDGVYIVNKDYDIEYVNPSIEKEFGLFKGQKCYEYLHDRDDVCPWCKNDEVFSGKTIHWEWTSKKVGKTYELFDIPLKNPNGSISKLEIFHDITDRKKTEEALKESEKILKIEKELAFKLSRSNHLIEVLNICLDAVINISGMDSGGIYLVDDYSGDLDLIVKSGLSDSFISSAGHYNAHSASARMIMEGRPIYTQYEKLNISLPKDRIKEDIHGVALLPIKYKGEVIANLNLASHTLEEISKQNKKALESIMGRIGEAIIRAKVEEALKESEEKYRTLFESDPDYTILLSLDGFILDVNAAGEFISGLSRDEFVGKHFTELEIFPEDDLELNGRMFSQLLKEGYVAPYEIRIYDKDGKIRWVYTQLTIINKNGEPNSILIIASDIEERKKSEEETKDHLKKLSILNQIINTANHAADLNILFKDILKSTRDMMGYDGGCIYLLEENKEFAKLVYHENYPDEFIEKYDRISLDEIPTYSKVYTYKKPLYYEISKTATISKTGFNSVAIVPLYSKGEVIGSINVSSSQKHHFSDLEKEIIEAIGMETGTVITRMYSEEHIKESLKEKEVLLKEIHHRVKNNLQIISSLLDLQEDYVSEDATAVNVLKESQNRVLSMAMIHEMIYQSKDLSHINFADYIRNLISNLFHSYGAGANINSQLNVEEIFLNIETAIPLGLLITELVSNSLKYAFP
ncbi:MAG: PAS domain S-box protein, partial [Methanobacterium sp.]|nr:PAS domain S-box protein [Methanobacterium sp.]